MPKPLVTVICISYNHERFIGQAIDSVINQTYEQIQIIIIDDGSADNSASVITQFKVKYNSLEVLLLTQNVGNCAAFNTAYALAKGSFIVDFATDDVMMPDRIEKQVRQFEQYGGDVGIVFTDATYIDEKGKFIRNHFEHLLKFGLILKVPRGDVYRSVLERYFIPSPTALIRRQVIDQLGGYDEKLSYEDFDLFVRASRLFKFEFLDERLTAVRKLSKSMSTELYKRNDKQLMSTYDVCLKATKLNRDAGDNLALIGRVRYELRQSVITENHLEATAFFKLLNTLDGLRFADRLTFFGSIMRLPLKGFRNIYIKVRFG
ncbi:MAG: glycosyltransferase [Chryseolinea sp.]